MLDESSVEDFHLSDKDLGISWYSGTGAGGQHRNKHQNSCRLTHLKTGIVVSAQCRSREQSLAQAKKELLQRIKLLEASKKANADSTLRKNLIGSGQRGDKIRTYRFQEDRVHDHVSGKSASCEKVLAGNFNLLWNI